MTPSLASAGFGPPGGPKSPPFWQCPAVGTSTSCSFLIDLTGDHNSPTTKVTADPSQEFYDSGKDDEIVAVQNDTDGPIAKIHLGVAGSFDNLFGFEGDGLCSPGVGATPTGCPFGGSGNTTDPYDYYGPDMAFEAGYTSDDGIVDFTPPLQPGQYTFFGLDAPCSDVSCDVEIATGNANDVLTSALTEAGNSTNNGAHLSRSTPGNFTDQATLNGANSGNAGGTVTYKLYSDANCTQQVADATPTPNTVTGGIIPASTPVGAALATNAVYYWQVTFTSSNSSNTALNTYNTNATSVCGGESMSFGTPPTRPSTGITTALSDGVRSGASLAVAAGTPVTDAATITKNGAPDSTATGTVTYSVYSDVVCSQQIATAFPVHGDIRQVAGGVAPASAGVNLPVGTYYFRAIYSGDANHASAAGSCGAEVLAVKTPTSLLTTLSSAGRALGASASVPPGTAVTDTATVLAGGVTAPLATGSVSYALYNAATDPTCMAAPAATEANAPVLGGSAAPFQAPNLPVLKPGRWLIVAIYSGDARFLAAASACGSEVLTVVPASVSAAKPKVINGVIFNTLTSNTAGTFTLSGAIRNAVAVLSRAKKCRAGTVRIRGKCVSTSFGSSKLAVTAAGAYTVKLAPNKRARSALGLGRTLHVTETVTFQPADGSKAAGRVITVTVKGRKKKH